ncbi:MAG TPA: hypothetical protein PLF81_00015 [Candidatus Anammoximicrobium sp.]|nr:hypothetical protein [Candidatus Anammoximicrobium sp.]
MKPRLVPLFFDPGRDSDFDRMLSDLRTLLAEHAEFLEPVPLGGRLPDADAVIFPQLLGVAYRQAPAFQAIDLPILLVTSEFGTLSMWDWEIAEYLRSQGVETIGPYSLEQTKKVCAALGVKRELRGTKFLVYQDDPGEGFQAPIFKRFYWWEDECTRRLADKFGITVVKKSFREFGATAQAIPDDLADATWERWKLPTEGLTQRAVRSAVKVYLAVCRDLDADGSIRAVGMNCLNESHFSDSTPCLAWNMLYQERGLVWGCEADTLSMATKYILHKSLRAPIMMTNLYPFVLGNAALKHERIQSFPAVESEPENHILVAHCGYMGVIPTGFATDWTLRKKVLAIVDENASAIDARLPVGDVTLAKLHPALDRMTVAEGQLTGYAQFPGSDCLNGGVIKVRDGHRLMSALASHHYLLLVGHHRVDLQFLGKVFGLAVQEV